MLYQVTQPIIQPRMRFFDADGKPLVGGKVYSFKVGTELFKPTYRDANKTALNTNPIVLDSDGSALIYLTGAHVLKVYDKDGNLIETRYVPETQARTQFFDKYGVPLKNGKVWTYDIASTIKKTSYANADKNQPNANPIVLDAEGWASISMIGSYRLRSYNEKGVSTGDQDFKRPVAKALTSKVYPVYFEDQMESSLELVKLYFGLSSSDDVATSLKIDSASLVDIITYTTIDIGSESASAGNAVIASASLVNTTSYVSVQIDAELIKANDVTISAAKLQATLISTAQQESLAVQTVGITTAILG